MKNLFYALLSLTVIAAVSCGTARIFTSDKYPDSIIIGAFENAGVNPEAFSVRVLRVVRAEIAVGRFTRDEVIEFIDVQSRLLSDGQLAYNLLGQIIERYGRDFFLPGGENFSEVALIAYYMLMPDLDSFDIESPIGEQDMEVAMEFLKYIRDGV